METTFGGGTWRLEWNLKCKLKRILIEMETRFGLLVVSREEGMENYVETTILQLQSMQKAACFVSGAVEVAIT